MICFTHIQMQKTIYEAKNSVGKLLQSSDDLDFVHLTIAPNSIIETHSISVVISFFIIQGSGSGI